MGGYPAPCLDHMALSLKALGASVRIFDILDRHSEVIDGNLEPLGFEGGEF